MLRVVTALSLLVASHAFMVAPAGKTTPGAVTRAPMLGHARLADHVAQRHLSPRLEVDWKSECEEPKSIVPVAWGWTMK